MKNLFLFILSIAPLLLFSQASKGFFNLEWNEKTGLLIMEIPQDKLGEKFLYVSSLTSGIGSNDIGLDRGKLGDQAVVSFYQSGNKLLLVEDNQKFRAVSDNKEESLSVEEAFAKSVVFGFKILPRENGGPIKISLNDFLLNDGYGVAKVLSNNKQGKYKLDKSRSAIYKEGILNFPKNTELEAILTLTGEAKGDYIKSVSPNPDAVTVRQHHSFIELPDDNYKMRPFHPESGFFYMSYADYASPIGDDMVKRFIKRHRLEKKNPGAEKSEAVEPIIYYLDRGCPEPVKSALMDGGKWWNQAFEAAGFIDAFQVKEMPVGAHPLDVRYNLIQWVHRSTRGWSYGSSIADPRTGEILKGHVSLGSLRVRQDFMIAQGVISSYDEETDDPRMLELALARLRQLSAHEIGHTIGLAHNFAASHNDRASVMDYPHPLIEEATSGGIDISKAYDTAIGAWDKRSIIYGYSEVPEGQSEAAYLKSLVEQNRADGFLFITDQDARPAGGLHPYAHLWDNGVEPIEELGRLIELRTTVLNNFGTGSIADGMAFSKIEDVLVPAYLMHRYQVEAVAKLIGGVDFNYALKGEKDAAPARMIDPNKQINAKSILLATLTPEFLEIPESVLALIPPPTYGYNRDRESFKGKTGAAFDPLSAAESSANHTLSFMLNPQRLARIDRNEKKAGFGLESYVNDISKQIASASRFNPAMHKMLEKLFTIHMLNLAANPKADKEVAGIAMHYLDALKARIDGVAKSGYKGHAAYLKNMLAQFSENPESFKAPELTKMPPGSPIGCGGIH